MQVALIVLVFFSVPIGFFIVYAIAIWREKPIEDHDAYAHVLRAHRAACETLGAKLTSTEKLLEFVAVRDNVTVTVHTRLRIGLTPRDTLVTANLPTGTPSFVSHRDGCNHKHEPAKAPNAGTPPAGITERLPAYCFGRDHRLWAWRSGGERDADALVSCVTLLADLASAPAAA